MREFKEVKLQQYPTNLLNKDWSKRTCGYFHKSDTESFFRQVRDFEVQTDDVWLVTCPKSGTTWMQELLWLVINDFDFDTAKNIDLEVRTPFFELEWDYAEDKENLFKRVIDLQSPRLIKSHFSLPLLPPQLWTKKPKTIYVFRNPKDALLSLYHHSRYFSTETESLDEFVTNRLEKYMTLNSPLEHAAEFYELRNESWIYYTSFERMKMNLRDVITDVCQFLKKPITEEQMQQMLKHLSFEEMQKNPKTNHYWEFEKSAKLLNIPFRKPNFIREGKIGGHKEAFSAELNEKLDNFLEKESIRLGYSLDKLLLLKDD